MKKINNRGFMLAETLIVTSFVAGVLIFLFIQFTNLSQGFNRTYKYNTVEDLYALEDIKDYIAGDATISEYIINNVSDTNYIEVSDCSKFTNIDYCTKLFELEKVHKVYITPNKINTFNFKNTTEEFKTFLNRINKEGTQEYRIIVVFKNSDYATIRL